VKTYYVYIVASASRVLYIGVTNDIQRRVEEHRKKSVPGFSSNYNTHELVHVEPFGSMRAAIAREKQLKRWIRAKKIALIELHNPHWKDLIGEWG
jgi:putative endonuclease